MFLFFAGVWTVSLIFGVVELIKIRHELEAANKALEDATQELQDRIPLR